MVEQEPRRRSGEITYALSGVIDGQERIFVLRSGVNTVGRKTSCDVVVSVPGVSLRHAVIEIEGANVEVRDLASKNGTFVGNSRIATAKIAVGQGVVFGGVRLKLEQIEPEDAWLEISSEGTRSTEEEGKPEPATSTIVWGGAVEALTARRWMRLYDDVTRTLVAGGSSALDQALAVLVRGLDARGAVLLEWRSENDNVVLATHGELPSTLPSRLIRQALSRAAKGGEAIVGETSADDGALTIAAGPDPTPLLLVAGVAADDVRAQPLLQTMRRILTLTRSGHAGSSSRRRLDSPELRFPEGFVPGCSAAMKTVYRQIAAVANADLPVLLVGETGVGKECLAETIQRSSDRAEEVFLPVNCAAIPTELLEAELFGIEKGVATGVDGRKGRFLLADKGTLFLDEIGDMSLGLQAKLLRVLEERAVRPVGGGAVAVDVRIIAATNTELEQKIEDGDFRRDLYFRLAGMVIRVPPVRQRQDDLAGLVEHFFHQACRRTSKTVAGITYGAMLRLAGNPWPGNVRQLRHVVYRLVFLCGEGRAIDSAQVARLDDQDLRISVSGMSERGESVASWKDLDIAKTERRLIEEALRRTDGNRSRAARLLGISRQALHRRLQRS